MTMEWQPVWLSLKLASVTTLLLLFVGTPIAWWLSRSTAWYKQALAAVVALPLILPPTVLGFYLLLMLGPKGFVGQLTQAMGLGTLPFTFTGLVLASMIYSLPFVVQPLQNSFETLGKRHLEVAATLRASCLDSFFTVILPMSRSGILTAAVLSFAHTVGEFGVVLMIGGSIPGETRVLSVAIYDHVEALEYGKAHFIAGAMMVFSFLVLMILYLVNGRLNRGNQL